MKNIIKDLLLVAIGNIILAFAVVAFIIPNSTLSGGVAGVAILIEPFTDLSVETIIVILTIALYVLGALFLGKKFAFNTIVSAVVYPLAVALLPLIVAPVYVSDLLSAIYSGLISGLGIGLAVSTGASTGGMDIPPLLMKKYLGIEMGLGVVIVDGLTILCGVFIYGIEKVLIGLICAYVSSVTIDKILMLKYSKAKSVQIISDRNDEISYAINHELDRGTTILYGSGGYTGEKRSVIMTVLPDREYPKLQALIDRYDRNAFVIISDVKDVRGEGFTFEAESRIQEK